MTELERFRRAMGWFHTWAGIGLGAILFAVFWMGTLSVFDHDIDLWMKPELRIAAPEPVVLDKTLLPYIQTLDLAERATVEALIPDERSPAIRVFHVSEDSFDGPFWLHPETGDVLDVTDTLGANGFFYPFHYSLHLNWMSLGYWIVGLASIGMMVLVISGVFIHRKLITDFFTFRPTKGIRRSSLDLHNLSSMVALPFHFLFPFTGILIFAFIYFPGPITSLFGHEDGYYEARYDGGTIAASGRAGAPLASIDRFVSRAETTWQERDGAGAGSAGFVTLGNIGDANAYVRVQRYDYADGDVPAIADHITFLASTEEVISDQYTDSVLYGIGWLEGLHFMQFDHWMIRWLYFLFGLSGCVMIGSGSVYWMQARIRKGTAEPAYIQAVRALTIGSITGIIAASGAFLAVNRLLSKDFTLSDLGRADIEVWVFFAIWIGTFLHAALRGRAAWREQAYLIALLGLFLPILNWITTGDHLFRTISSGVWAVACTDLVLISIAIVAVIVARRLGRAPAAARAAVISDIPNQQAVIDK